MKKKSLVVALILGLFLVHDPAFSDALGESELNQLHQPIPENHEVYDVVVDTISVDPTRRLRFWLKFTKIHHQGDADTATISFPIYQHSGVNEFLDYVQATFPQMVGGETRLAETFDDSKVFRLYIWKIQDRHFNFALKSLESDFFWLNESKPYPPITWD